jgi:chromosome segregation ATPase
MADSMSETRQVYQQAVLTVTEPTEQTMDVFGNTLIKIEQRLTNIEKFGSRLDNIEENIKTFNESITRIETQIKGLNVTVSDLKTNLQSLSDFYDDLKEKVGENEKTCHEIAKDMNDLKRNHQVCGQSTDFNADIMDLRCRSMQQNLVFRGLMENGNENCEALIKEFIENELNIEKDIELDRAHRMGKRRSNMTKPRKIVARFTKFKDKELVLSEARKNLRQKPYSVFEQFPDEIEERRRKLYPLMHKATFQGHKVRLYRDRLYVDGIEVHAADTDSSGRDSETEKGRRAANLKPGWSGKYAWQQTPNTPNQRRKQARADEEEEDEQEEKRLRQSNSPV